MALSRNFHSRRLFREPVMHVFSLSSVRSVCALCCALLFLAVPTKARSENFTLHYAMYAGGFQAMTLSVAFDFYTAKSIQSYNVKMNAEPYGILGHILPWAGEYKTAGVIDKSLSYPSTHTTISRWREDQDSYSMVFRNKELISVRKIETENGKTTSADLPLDPEFHHGAVDVVTASLRVIQHLQTAGNCTSSSAVFDGKRRFELKFTAQGKEDLTSTRYNMFNGPTDICQVEMIPLKGYKDKPKGYYKIQEAARARGQLPRIWFGQVWPNGRLVPVKMLVKSEYGAVFVHLQKVTRKK